jgi:hypothetical protein
MGVLIYAMKVNVPHSGDLLRKANAIGPFDEIPKSPRARPYADWRLATSAQGSLARQSQRPCQVERSQRRWL